MSQAPHSEPPPLVGGAPAGSLVYAIAISIVLFLLLPLTQLIEQFRQPNTTEIASVTEPPPPPPLEEPPPPPEEEEEEEVEEIEEQREPPSLDLLELAINPDFSGEFGGDFNLNTFDIPDVSELIFELKDLDEGVRPTTQVRAVYPPAMKRQGRGGTVTVQFIVDEEGSVRNPFIERSPDPAFSKAVLDVIRKWKFSVPMKDGEPVKVRVRLPYTFNVED